MKILILLIVLIFLVIIVVVKNQRDNYLDLEITHHLLNKYLKDFDEICMKYDIQYWADAGTLLGAVRDKGIIAHDDDVDVCLYEPEMSKLKTVIEQHYPNYEITCVPHYEHYKLKRKNLDNVWIDLFPVEDYENAVRYKYPRHRELWPNYYNLKDDLFPLKKVQFHDYQLFIPKNPYPYLTRAYGDWETPVNSGRHKS